MFNTMYKKNTDEKPHFKGLGGNVSKKRVTVLPCANKDDSHSFYEWKWSRRQFGNSWL